jgi:DNA-binding response OmpR family regulator
MNKVLVVDDDPEILSLVEIILGMNNFEVSAISQWERIDTSIDDFKPDLLLLDVSLGGADGREICKRLKQSKETETLPVILFSANAILKNDLSDCNAQDFIAKPFELSHLVKTIKTHLN